MVALPSRAQITDVAADGPTMAPRFGDLRDFVAQLRGAQAKSEITIAAGVVTPDRYYHTVDTEADAAADNLDQLALTNLPDGSEVLLMAENAARVVTLRHLNGTGAPGTNGEMVLNNDESFALDHALAYIVLQRVGTQWIERRRSRVFGRRLEGAADAAAARTLLDVSQAINSLTAETAPAIGDLLALRDVSAGADRKMTLENALKVVAALTALTAIAVDDGLLIYDLSATQAKVITPVELLEVLNGLTADGTPDAANDYALTYDASAATVKKVLLQNIASKLKIAVIRDEKANGTSGGGSSATRAIRDLNTEASDPDAIVSISSNEFVLQAGTYLIVVIAPFMIDNGQGGRIWLENVTDTTDVATAIVGAGGGAAAPALAVLPALVTIAAQKNFAIDHQVSAARATDGLGRHDGISAGNEVYTQVLIIKLA